MMGQGQSASIKAEAISCLRGGRMLFEALSFELSPGDAMLISGPNGSGKSSLLRLLAGLLDPVAGRVLAEGGLALADEGLALDPAQKLGKALNFWARIDGAVAASPTPLEQMALDHLADVPVRILSTGQRKRAVLARTIGSRASIWLLDEPGNGLDTASLELLGKAVATHRQAGGIVIATSHQPLDLPGASELVLTA